MDMLHCCFQSWITFWWCQDLPVTLMIIVRKVPKMILLHGLKTTTMVVDASVLRCIFHANQCMSPSGSGTVDSLHLMSILYVILGDDNQLYLPKSCLQRVLVLCTVIVDGGVQISVVVIQHLSKKGVVVGRLRGLLEVVFACPAYLLIHHRDSWGWHRRW